jgi:hypothetical protein
LAEAAVLTEAGKQRAVAAARVELAKPLFQASQAMAAQV